MERVCDRVIVIHRGRLLLDQPTARLRAGFIGRKRITVHSAAERLELALDGVALIERAPHRTRIDVDLGRVSVEQVVQALLAATSIADLSIEDPPMEEIVRAIYARAEREAADDEASDRGPREALPCTA
jgi:ABC-2 type transport system ATP-binding protein